MAFTKLENARFWLKFDASKGDLSWLSASAAIALCCYFLALGSDY